MDANQLSDFGLSQPKNTVILQSAVKQLIIINCNVACVSTSVPRVNKDPAKNIISCVSTSPFYFKVDKTLRGEAGSCRDHSQADHQNPALPC